MSRAIRHRLTACKGYKDQRGRIKRYVLTSSFTLVLYPSLLAMSLPKAQQPLVSDVSPPLSLLAKASTCHGVWDAREARFQECFLPVLSLLPGLVAVITLLTRVVGPFFRKAPQWLKPFVVEYDEGTEVIPLQAKQRFSPWALVLLICSITGLMLGMIALLWPHPNFVALLPTISWVGPPK